RIVGVGGHFSPLLPKYQPSHQYKCSHSWQPGAQPRPGTVALSQKALGFHSTTRPRTTGVPGAAPVQILEHVIHQTHNQAPTQPGTRVITSAEVAPRSGQIQ